MDANADPLLGWRYSYLDIDCAPEEAGPFESVLAAWNAKRRPEGGLPAWSDFDMTNFRRWHGWLNMFEVLRRDPICFRYRLWGSWFREFLGQDLTWIEICGDGYGFDEDDFRFLSGLIEGPKIGVWSGPVFWQEREYVHLSLFSLPLSSDGRQVDRVLTAGRAPLTG